MDKAKNITEPIRENWITSPFSYLQLGGRLTLLQQDTMLMVSNHLQEYVKNFFDLGLHKSGARPRSLFTQYLLEHGIPPFRIYLSELGINASNYRVIREAVEEMNLLVEHIELDGQDRPTGRTVFSPVFKRLTVPVTGDKYVKRDEEGEVLLESARHYGYIEVEINNDVAQFAFDMSQGYVNHPKTIARYATKRSTPRLYFLLMREMGRKKSTTVRMTVQEVKDFLGYETYKDEQTGEWVVPYQKFAHFKTKILDQAKADLDRMARDGHSDITFTYEPVYENGRRRGDPDFVAFTLHSTRLGLEYQRLTGTENAVTAQARTEAERVAELDARTDARWTKCRQWLLDYTTNEESRRRIMSLRYEHYDPEKKRLTILVPDTEIMRWLEHNALEVLRSAIRGCFDADATLRYSVAQAQQGGGDDVR